MTFICRIVCVVLLAGSVCRAGMVVRRWMPAEKCSDRGTLICFDLSDLPPDAKVFWAELRLRRISQPTGRDDDALTNIEVYPLFDNLKRRLPTPEGEPLRIRGPWFDRLDATDAVRRWTAPRFHGGKLAPAQAGGGFLVKTAPRCDLARTCLDIAYEGQAETVPPQVTELRVTHRAGQTFLTWKEINDPIGRDKLKWGELKSIVEEIEESGEVCYCIYRSSKPISAGTLHVADRIATVEPLSCWNANGRNVERPIDETIARQAVLVHGQGNPFADADPEGPYGLDCAIDRFVIPGSPVPLPRCTGLYVHTTGSAGKPTKAHYAVVTSINGVQNTVEFSAANSTSEPVAETAGDGEPVLQGVLPEGRFWRYPQRRLHYVRWVAAPYGNLPSQYFNWSVGVPERLGENVPLELNLHRDNGSYWRTQYRLERDSIVLSGHDFPLRSWWYGYHECQGTLKSFSQGRIHNFTERRLLKFIDWAVGRWPVDRNRIVATGVQYSGSAGALRLGLHHPKVFNSIVAGRAVPDMAYIARELNAGRNQGKFDELQRLWGKFEWKLRTDSDRNVWDVLNLNRLLEELPVQTELPLVAMTSDHTWKPCHEFYSLMLEKRQPILANFTWGGQTLLPVSPSSTWPNAIHLDVRRNRLLPVFNGISAKPLLDSGKQGEFNLPFRFRSDDLVDRPDRLEVTLFWVELYGNRSAPKADVTLRRLQHFKVEPGRTYRWTATPLGRPSDLPPTGFWRKHTPSEVSGQVIVGKDGLLTICGVDFNPLGSRLVVRPK